VTKSTLPAGRAAAAALLFAMACGAACCAACCAACGASQPAARASTVSESGGSAAVPAAAVPAAAVPAASACPVRHAWADEVTAAGRIGWQVSLPTDPGLAGITPRPLVGGGEAVFAEENAVYAIRLRDGRRLWRHAFSKQITALTGAVYGLWPGAPGSVVALTGQVSDDARLTELNLTTGAAGWSLKVPGPGLLGTQAQTADRTLAIQRDNGDVESVDLVTGRVLWSRHVGTSAGPAAVAAVIAAGAASRAAGYADRSGRLLWTALRLPQQTNLTAADGLFLAWSNTQGGGASTSVTALNPQTGRAEWTFDPGEPVAILGAGPAGIALATYVPRRREYLVNAATGEVRWSAAAFAASEDDAPGQLAETGSSVVLPEASTAAPPGDFRVVARSAASGRVQWSMPIGGGGFGSLNLALLPLAGGQAVAVAVVRGSGSGISTRLTVHRLATGRQLAAATLPDVVSAPLTVTGDTIIAQSDSPSCAVASTGLRVPASSLLRQTS
jgi:outer membrane protein assembly factor BamB